MNEERMTTDETQLGALIERHAPRGGVMGMQDRSGVRTALLTFAGAVVGVIPGLFVAIFTDFVPALLIGAVLGGIAGFWWATRRLNFDAVVTEARLHERGIVLVDPRGTHAVPFDQVASIQGKHLTTVLETGFLGIGDTEGVTEHSYLVRTRDGTGYWLDDRVTKVVGLVTVIAERSGVAVTPMR
jgi:hypothetical protein